MTDAKKEYRITYSDYICAESKQEALEIALSEIRVNFRAFAKVKKVKAE